MKVKGWRGDGEPRIAQQRRRRVCFCPRGELLFPRMGSADEVADDAVEVAVIAGPSLRFFFGKRKDKLFHDSIQSPIFRHLSLNIPAGSAPARRSLGV